MVPKSPFLRIHSLRVPLCLVNHLSEVENTWGNSPGEMTPKVFLILLYSVPAPKKTQLYGSIGTWVSHFGNTGLPGLPEWPGHCTKSSLPQGTAGPALGSFPEAASREKPPLVSVTGRDCALLCPRTTSPAGHGVPSTSLPGWEAGRLACPSSPFHAYLSPGTKRLRPLVATALDDDDI